MKTLLVLTSLMIALSWASPCRASDPVLQLSSAAKNSVDAPLGQTVSLTTVEAGGNVTCADTAKKFTIQVQVNPGTPGKLPLNDSKLHDGATIVCSLAAGPVGTVNVPPTLDLPADPNAKPTFPYGATVSLASTKDMNVACVDQGGNELKKGTVNKAAPLMLPLTADSLKAGGKAVCKNGDALVATIGVDAVVAPVPAPVVKVPVTTSTECTEDQLDPPQAQAAALIQSAKCGVVESDVVRVCVGESGGAIGPIPDLRGGQHLVVTLLTRDDQTDKYTLGVTYDRIVVKGSSELAASTLKSGKWVQATHWNVPLDVAGTVTIAVTRKDHTEAPDNDSSTNPPPCHVSATTRNQIVDVTGTYYFSAGVMVSYTDLFDRQYSLAAGGDGVIRIAQNDSHNADIVADLVAYPFGVVDGKDKVAPGFVFGTSLRDLGKRWYFGLQISSPMGFGIAGGVALSALPSLNGDLVAGQPFSGTTIPTGTTVVPTWFVGVNLEDGLFKKMFGALLPKQAAPTQ